MTILLWIAGAVALCVAAIRLYGLKQNRRTRRRREARQERQARRIEEWGEDTSGRR